MGNKELKNRTPISNAIDSNIHKKLKKYSDDTGIPISKILDKALEDYLKKKTKSEK